MYLPPRDDNAQAVLAERARALIEFEEAEKGRLSTDAMIYLLLRHLDDVENVQDARGLILIVEILRELEEEDRERARV